jgi:hypothetical protein
MAPKVASGSRGGIRFGSKIWNILCTRPGSLGQLARAALELHQEDLAAGKVWFYYRKTTLFRKLRSRSFGARGGALGWPKLAHDGSRGPRWPQDCPRWLQAGSKMTPRWLQDAPRWLQESSKMAPRWLKGPKMTPRCPKMAQDSPRWPQDGPRWPQAGPKMAPSWLQDGPKIAARWLQAGPGWLQDCSKTQDGSRLAPRWPKRKAQDGYKVGGPWPKMTQIGSLILDPLSSSYSSSWLFLAPPGFCWLLFLAPPDSAWHLRLTRYVLRCCKFTPAFYIGLNNHCQFIPCRTSTVTDGTKKAPLKHPR